MPSSRSPMRLLPRLRSAAFAFAFSVAACPLVVAQHHGGRSAPATAPPPPGAQALVPAGPFAPVSSGMGPIQFSAVSYGVPAPQTLIRQIRFDDDRTRSAALSALGVPPIYLQHGHVAYPHTVDLTLAALSISDELDALLTVEMDNHIVTAVLVPDGDNWRRIATLTYATPYADTTTTPFSWLRMARTFTQRDRYRAVFHASTGSFQQPSFIENEAQLRILNGHAVITISFASTARECDVPNPQQPPPAKPPRKPPVPGCEIIHRWLQPDPADPTHHFELITGSGRLTLQEATQPYADSRTMLETHLHTFACQPFMLTEPDLHFEPTGPSAACPTH